MRTDGEIKLKPCPFCRGEAIREKWRLPLMCLDVPAWRVICTECQVQVYGMRKCDASRKWNRRATNAD